MKFSLGVVVAVFLLAVDGGGASAGEHSGLAGDAAAATESCRAVQPGERHE